MAETLASLMQGVEAAGSVANTSAPQAVTTGIDQGIRLAKAQQDVQQAQIQTEQMKDTLDTKKFDKLMGMTRTYLNSSPVLRKKMAPQLYQSATRSGLNVQDGYFESVADDPELNSNMKSLLQAYTTGAPMSPEDARKGLMAAEDFYGTGQDLLRQMGTNTKAARTAELTQNKYETTLEAARIGAAGRVDAANAAGGARQARNSISASRDYNAVMKQAEAGLTQSNRALHLVEGIDSGKLQSNKTLRSDLTGVLSTLVNNGRPASVYGMQEQELSSLWARVMDAANTIGGDARSTIPQKQLNQLKIDIQALQGQYAQQHEDQYRSFRESYNEPALQQIQKNIDNRANMFRRRQGLNQINFQDPNADMSTTVSGSQTPAAGGGQAPPAPARDITKDLAKLTAANAKTDQKLRVLKANGYSNAEIMAALNGGK